MFEKEQKYVKSTGRLSVRNLVALTENNIFANKCAKYFVINSNKLRNSQKVCKKNINNE